MTVPRRLLVVLLALIAAPLVAPPATAQAPLPTPLPTLKAAINQEVARARQIAPEIGVDVVEVASGRRIYSFEPETKRILASNTKLFTAAAALDRLGPGFFFETPVYVRGEIQEGALRGDLGVVGGGDPNISGRLYQGDPFGAFREWAAVLRGLGIRRIEGDILLATGLFDRRLVHPDWPEDQLDRWYEAPVAALSFNDNCVLVKVEPIGSPARVGLVPALPIFEVEGTVRVTSDPRREGVRIGRPTRVPDWERLHTFEVGGAIHRSTEFVDRWVTVADPAAYFGTALRQALLEEGIGVRGKVRELESLPGVRWRKVLTHRTGLLGTLEIVNKRSQNFYSEQVLKLLGARFCGEGTWAGGVRAVSEFLVELGLDSAAIELADGSGMSRGNRATPRLVTDFLRAMSEHRWSREFLGSLPHSGEADLRWERRLAEPPYRGNVLAKTGSLSGVSALSGYAKGRSGTLYAFSILMNRSSANWRARNAQDAILRALIDHG